MAHSWWTERCTEGERVSLGERQGSYTVRVKGVLDGRPTSQQKFYTLPSEANKGTGGPKETRDAKHDVLRLEVLDEEDRGITTPRVLVTVLRPLVLLRPS